MENEIGTPQTTGMDIKITTHYELITRATELAYEVFSAPTDERIEWIALRLEWNYFHGLGESGATTLH